MHHTKPGSHMVMQSFKLEHIDLPQEPGKIYADFIYYNATLHNNYVAQIICTVSVKLYLHYFSERFPLSFSQFHH